MKNKNLFLVILLLSFSSIFLGCDWFDDEETEPSSSTSEIVSTETPSQEVETPNKEVSGVSTTTPIDESVGNQEPKSELVASSSPSETKKEIVIDIKPATITPSIEDTNELDPFPNDWRRSIFESIPKNFEVKYFPDLDMGIIEEINNYREQNGLNRLEVSQDLMYTARYKSLSQAERSYIDHPNPEFDNKKAGYLIWQVFKHDSDGYAENLILSTFDTGKSPYEPSWYFNLWKGSPGHNSNMLIPFGKYIGVSSVAVIDTTQSYTGCYLIYTTMHITD